MSKIENIIVCTFPWLKICKDQKKRNNFENCSLKFRNRETKGRTKPATKKLKILIKKTKKLCFLKSVYFAPYLIT